MSKKVLHLVNQALEGINYILDRRDNLFSLTSIELLPEIKNDLLTFLKNNNLSELRAVLDSYKQSNMLMTGETDYNSVWYQEVQVRGRATVLGKILDDLDNAAWELVKEDVKQ